MARRIDSLYCNSGTAESQIAGLCEEVQRRADAVRQEVAQAVSDRIAALEEREKELLQQIHDLASYKVEALKTQLAEISQGMCPPAFPEDPDTFLINADAVISFSIPEDFMDKVTQFGSIGEASTYASLSYAKGPALGVLKEHNPSYLWVYACDRNGQRRKEGGNVVLAELSNPEAFQNVEVEDLKDGRYKLTFVPLASNDYSLNLSIKNPDGSDEAIFGSPFALTVRAPTNYLSIGVEEAHVEGKLVFGQTGVPHVPNGPGFVHHPSGVDFDSTGSQVFVVDQGNHRVQVFGVHDQNPICTFGKKGFGAHDFDTPCDIVVDRDNRAVITDQLNHRLQVLEYSLTDRELRHVRTIGQAGQAPRCFHFPRGICFAENGHLFVCDTGNHRVQVLDSLDGYKFVREFGKPGEGEGEFINPLDATVNNDGEILVSDSSNRIQVFDAHGTFLRSFGTAGRREGCFEYPTNMAVNDENALFVCDQGNHRVQVLNAKTGQFLHSWAGSKKKKVEGEEEAPADEENPDKPPPWCGLKKPAGIAVNTHGLVIVSDHYHDKVLAF